MSDSHQPRTGPRGDTDGPGTSAAAIEPVWSTIVRLPSRILFVGVALVQIAVEMAITAAQDAWANRSGRGSD